LSVPIYERGVTYSQLRSAKLSAGKSRIDVLTAQQSVTEAADIAWEALSAARAQIASFKEQIEAAQIALAGVRNEANVGQRTVLDVLNAEQELLTAQVSLVQSQRDEIVAAYQLKESVGEMTAAQLELPVAVYDPDDYYRRTRNKWIGSSTD
jgi:outer membrane protein